MKYTKFEIENYKGIGKINLDLNIIPDTKVFTLVGLNESGKTTILEAMHFWKKGKSLVEMHTLIPKAQKYDFNGIVSIKAFLEFNENDEEKLINYAESLGYRSIQFKTKISITRKYKFKSSEYINEGPESTWDIALMGKKKGKSNHANIYDKFNDDWRRLIDYIEKQLMPDILYYPNFLFDFPSKIYLEEYPNEGNEQKTYREVLSDILYSVNLSIEEHIVERLKSKRNSSKEALDSTMIRVGSAITKTVFNAWATLFYSKGKEIILKPGIEKNAQNEEQYYLEVKLKEKGNQFQISERSLGFKWFFTFLLFTEFRKSRQGNKGETLFLLDEPASNLHSTAQINLLATFEKLVTNCKLIYSTHSHHLINPKWLNGCYIVKNLNLDYENEFEYQSEDTKIEVVTYKKFVVDHPQQKTYFQPILDALDCQPGLLEEVPSIVLTEGKSDYYIFKYINEIILNRKYNLNFYPGNGADRNNDVIALYIAWSRPFKILLDGNGAGIKAKQRYLSVFKGDIENNIITLRDISADLNCEIELLFDESDRVFISKTLFENEESYNKSKFNSALLNLYIQKKKILISEQTLSRFEKVLRNVSKMI